MGAYPVRFGMAVILAAMCAAVSSIIIVSAVMSVGSCGAACGHVIGFGFSDAVGMVPFVGFVALCDAVGLLVLALPVTLLMGDDALRWWAALVPTCLCALAIGMVAGLRIGVAFGAPTGFWWWFFYRRVIIRRASVQN